MAGASLLYERRRRFMERERDALPSEVSASCVVVVPSLTFPDSELRKIVGIVHYEERLLCLLLRLQDPGLRMVYVTSMPVDDGIIDYYLSFVGDPIGARARLTLVSVGDPSVRSLSAKLLDSPRALGAVKDAVDDPDDAYLLTFNTTPLELSVAEAFGIPLYGPVPEMMPLGSKSGARRIAARAGVPLLDGAGELFSMEDVHRAAMDLRRRRPDIDAIVVKLNNGFSGQGNAIVDVACLESSLERSPTTFCAAEESWPSFAAKIRAEGAIVEELVRGPGVVSPSVQVAIAPGGRYEVVSTHDQVLGGPDLQVYLGCRFPAGAPYRDAIQRHAVAIARELAADGVMGSFGIDLIVIPHDDGHRIYLSEINLRMGGTTHPFLMAKLATGGTYERDSGELMVDGEPRRYVATDNLKSARYVGLTPRRVLEALGRNGLAFDPSAKIGVTLHLLGALERFGKLGVVCIAPTRSEADDVHAGVVATLDELAGTSGSHR